MGASGKGPADMGERCTEGALLCPGAVPVCGDRPRTDADGVDCEVCEHDLACHPWRRERSPRPRAQELTHQQKGLGHG